MTHGAQGTEDGEDFDYVVVGGGAAGCIVAARLAEDPRNRVCLLEAGRSDEGDVRFLDYRNWTALVGNEDDFYYAVEPQSHGNSRVGISAARILGGSSSHNTSLVFRTPDVDLRAWMQRGAEGWSPDACAPVLDYLLTRLHSHEADPKHPVAAAFVAAAAATGYPLRDLATADFDQCVGWLNLNTKDGVRQSSSVSYLHPLAALPPNLTVRTETPVARVLFDGAARAIGVAALGGVVRTRREVVLAAGAIGTPKLLLLSGVGPREHLQDLDIGVVVDRAGVGQNLQDHVEGLVMFEASRPFPPSAVHSWEAGLFARSRDDLDVPDIQIHFGTEAYDMHTKPLGYESPQYAISLSPNVARPASRGWVRLRSTDPTEPPRVDPGYLSDAEGRDAHALIAGMRIARRLAETRPLRDWIAREVAPGAHAQTDAELMAFLREAHASVFHPAGTCRIGPATDPGAVVDARLRVHGAHGLRIADASVFPTLVGVNPCLTCMLVGERAADFIAREHDGTKEAPWVRTETVR